MIYLQLFAEFFKIGLFAIGGGLATIPFLYELSEKYGWFSVTDLTKMIVISEATPGPVGVNMATFAGFNTAHLWGALAATLGLVLPSVIIIITIAKLMDKYSCNVRVKDILDGMRPAVVALILFAGVNIAKEVVLTSFDVLFMIILLVLMRVWKKGPIFYICLSAVVGIFFGLQ